MKIQLNDKTIASRQDTSETAEYGLENDKFDGFPVGFPLIM